MLNLLRALIIAIKAHKGQKDKGGHLYIWHPIRVALNVKDLSKKRVALLHDVLEDTNYTMESLNFLNDNEKEALSLLTHDDGKPYMIYIHNLKKNSIARAVKLADLEQNMSINRLRTVTEKDLK